MKRTRLVMLWMIVIALAGCSSSSVTPWNGDSLTEGQIEAASGSSEVAAQMSVLSSIGTMSTAELSALLDLASSDPSFSASASPSLATLGTKDSSAVAGVLLLDDPERRASTGDKQTAIAVADTGVSIRYETYRKMMGALPYLTHIQAMIENEAFTIDENGISGAVVGSVEIGGTSFVFTAEAAEYQTGAFEIEYQAWDQAGDPIAWLLLRPGNGIIETKLFYVGGTSPDIIRAVLLVDSKEIYALDTNGSDFLHMIHTASGNSRGYGLLNATIEVDLSGYWIMSAIEESDGSEQLVTYFNQDAERLYFLGGVEDMMGVEMVANLDLNPDSVSYRDIQEPTFDNLEGTFSVHNYRTLIRMGNAAAGTDPKVSRFFSGFRPLTLALVVADEGGTLLQEALYNAGDLLNFTSIDFTPTVGEAMAQAQAAFGSAAAGAQAIANAMVKRTTSNSMLAAFEPIPENDGPPDLSGTTCAINWNFTGLDGNLTALLMFMSGSASMEYISKWEADQDGTALTISSTVDEEDDIDEITGTFSDDYSTLSLTMPVSTNQLAPGLTMQDLFDASSIVSDNIVATDVGGTFSTFEGSATISAKLSLLNGMGMGEFEDIDGLVTPIQGTCNMEVPNQIEGKYCSITMYASQLTSDLDLPDLEIANDIIASDGRLDITWPGLELDGASLRSNHAFIGYDWEDSTMNHFSIRFNCHDGVDGCGAGTWFELFDPYDEERGNGDELTCLNDPEDTSADYGQDPYTTWECTVGVSVDEETFGAHNTSGEMLMRMVCIDEEPE